MLTIKLSFFRRKNKKLKKKEDSSTTSRRDSLLMEELKDALITGGDTHYLLENVDTSVDLTKRTRFKSALNLPTYLKENEKVEYTNIRGGSTVHLSTIARLI